MAAVQNKPSIGIFTCIIKDHRCNCEQGVTSSHLGDENLINKVAGRVGTKIC